MCRADGKDKRIGVCQTGAVYGGESLRCQMMVFHWPEYYMGSENPEENILDADSDMVEKFNGRLVRKANGEYGLKVNIYGYDDRMLNELNDYLLEGEIDPEKMREEDTVILATLMDGQGNYDGISVSPGDALSVRIPKTAQTELLKFQGEDSLYQNSDLQVQAVVSRTLARVDQFLRGWSSQHYYDK